MIFGANSIKLRICLIQDYRSNNRKRQVAPLITGIHQDSHFTRELFQSDTKSGYLNKNLLQTIEIVILVTCLCE